MYVYKLLFYVGLCVVKAHIQLTYTGIIVCRRLGVGIRGHFKSSYSP